MTLDDVDWNDVDSFGWHRTLRTKGGYWVAFVARSPQSLYVLDVGGRHWIYLKNGICARHFPLKEYSEEMAYKILTNESREEYDPLDIALQEDFY